MREYCRERQSHHSCLVVVLVQMISKPNSHCTPSYANPNRTPPLVALSPLHPLHLTSGPGAAATAISLLIASALSSLGRTSKILLHHKGGSKGRDPLCRGGYTSQKKYQTCPMTTPMISSFGIVPWRNKLKPISTQGRYGAVNTKSPKKLSRVSGFRRDQI